MGKISKVVVFGMLCGLWSASHAAKLVDVRVLDKDYLMVTVLDGEVTHRDDGKGIAAFLTTFNESDADTVKTYAPLLSTPQAQSASNWIVRSNDDANFGTGGLTATSVHRKSKLNGHAQKAWSNDDYIYESTLEHVLFLKMYKPLQSGKTYSLSISNATNIDQTSVNFTYDLFQSVSEAIHVNLAGYSTDGSIKSADLFAWLGDGNARDYSAFQGNKVYLRDENSGVVHEVGTVQFWKNSANDVGGYNLTRSNVWNVDFTGFTTPGTYRLAVEGVGASQAFQIAADAYYNPYLVSVRGFYYMRIGQDSGSGIWPVPRRPLWIPEVNPASTKVILTTLHPYHANWESFSGGSDPWDKQEEWATYAKSGNPTNSRAKGGHSDALDWDRHLGHISIIYDMLLPYILTEGKLSDDNLGIFESGNGIPDLLDEARNEVDFWLNLRDGAGYAHGLNNPIEATNTFYQAGTTGVAAWANAANAAMLADCFRLSGHIDLMEEYRDSAIVAYNYANSLADPMLDQTQDVGDGAVKGRDLKMMAAAYLYNVTGNTTYEDVVQQESKVTDANSVVFSRTDEYNQLWALAGYLKTPQVVHYSTLFNNMKASVIAQAKSTEANFSTSRPSRRSTPDESGYFRTVNNVDHSIIAHAVADGTADKSFLLNALYLEADYGLGRNAMNMIQMTTQTTPLADKRSVQGAYTSGRDDGAPGMHPGHTPYMNLDDWYCGLQMGCPSMLYATAYPSDFTNNWPIDEGYFNTRYVWAHNEFTPQQTMRGKMALYGYLYGLGTTHTGSPVSFPKGNSSFAPGSFHIQVFDLQGRVQWQGQRFLSESSDLQKLDVGFKGLFVIHAKGNSGTVVLRKLWY